MQPWNTANLLAHTDFGGLMEQVWQISGAFAEWTLTLSVEPPKDSPETPLEEWPSHHAQTIGHIFRDLVNCHENALELETYQRTRGYVAIS